MDVSFFGEMAWKSALISGAALGLAYVLRSRAAADRALVLRFGVAMLLLLPFIALALPALQIEAWAAPEPAAPLAYVPPEVALAYLAAADPAAAPAPTIWDDPTPLVLLAYLGGLLMAGGRLLAGLVMLGRWTRQARPVDCPEWLAAFEQARLAAPDGARLRLMVSDAVPSPLSWGWRNPVILIDPDTRGEPEEAAAILAHEVAHVARRDWPVLMLTRIAATLFWFNPLVWLLEREIVQQAEEAADCEAARCVEPARYARTLLSWAQANGGMVPAHSIAPAGSALSRRVKAILDRRIRERPSGSPWTAFAAVLCVAIAAPIAAMQLVEAARAEEAPQAPAAPAAPEAPGAPQAPAAPPARDAPRAPDSIDDGDLAEIGPAVNEALAEVLPHIPQIVASATAALDSVEIERITAEALRSARPHLSREARAEMREAHREAARAMARARVQLATVDRAEIARAMAEAQRAIRAVPRTIALSMARSAAGMENGAAGMERGARNMEEEARRLQDPDYRDRQIARARARGETVTHEELLEAAEGLREGAEGMREGAEGMREAARDMRDDAED